MGSLGMPEILIILVIALIVFGPRKLPELGKTLGKSLAQFRRASEDFKRQWEDEVTIEGNGSTPRRPGPRRTQRFNGRFTCWRRSNQRSRRTLLVPTAIDDASGRSPEEKLLLTKQSAIGCSIDFSLCLQLLSLNRDTD